MFFKADIFEKKEGSMCNRVVVTGIKPSALGKSEPRVTLTGRAAARGQSFCPGKSNEVELKSQGITGLGNDQNGMNRIVEHPGSVSQANHCGRPRN